MNGMLGLLTIALLAVTSACSLPSHPAGVIRLTYGSPFSSTHPFSEADKSWIAEVEKRSGGRIHIDAYWGGSMVSTENNISELRHGLTDIAVISPIYARGGMQIIKAQSGFYGGARTIDQQLQIYRCASSLYPAYAKEVHGIHVLAVQGGALIHLITRDRLIKSLDDLQGLRLRAPSEMLPVLRPLGVDVLTMPMGDVYSALSKGMIDGVVAPADTLKSFHFGEVARYFNAMDIARGAYPARAIRDEAWHRLPPDLQKIMLDLQPFWEKQIKERIERVQQDGIDAGVKDRITFTNISSAEQARFDALYRLSADQTARKLDREGQQGSAILSTIRYTIATGRCAQPGPRA